VVGCLRSLKFQRTRKIRWAPHVDSNARKKARGIHPSRLRKDEQDIFKGAHSEILKGRKLGLAMNSRGAETRMRHLEQETLDGTQ